MNSSIEPQEGESDWYLVDGVAKYWDGDKFRKFIFNFPVGWYDFQGNVLYWDGIALVEDDGLALVEDDGNKLSQDDGKDDWTFAKFWEGLKLFASFLITAALAFVLISGLFFSGSEPEVKVPVSSCDGECRDQVRQAELDKSNDAEIDRIKSEVWCDQNIECSGGR